MLVVKKVDGGADVLNVRKGGYQNRISAIKGERGPNFGHFVRT